MRQQCVGSNVKRRAQEHVRAVLIELAAELTTCDVGLEQQTARRQRRIGDFGNIPGADDVATAIWVGLQNLQRLCNLIDVVPIRSRPGAPLYAVDRTEVAIVVYPLVPDSHSAVLKPPDVRVAAEEPQQPIRDGLQVHLFNGSQWGTLAQTKVQLVAEHRASIRTRAI